jgi:hypothetical protein
LVSPWNALNLLKVFANHLPQVSSSDSAQTLS